MRILQQSAMLLACTPTPRRLDRARFLPASAKAAPAPQPEPPEDPAAILSAFCNLNHEEVVKLQKSLGHVGVKKPVDLLKHFGADKATQDLFERVLREFKSCAAHGPYPAQPEGGGIQAVRRHEIHSSDVFYMVDPRDKQRHAVIHFVDVYNRFQITLRCELNTVRIAKDVKIRVIFAKLVHAKLRFGHLLPECLCSLVWSSPVAPLKIFRRNTPYAKMSEKM